MKRLKLFVVTTLTFWSCLDLVVSKSIEKVELVTCTTTKYFKSEHSLTKPYHENGTAGWDIPNWDYEGNTVITKDSVRLTSERPRQFGVLRNTLPFTKKNWEVQLQFKIQTTGDSRADQYQNGFSFWYTNKELKTGPIFGARDNFHGLSIAIENSDRDPDNSRVYGTLNHGENKIITRLVHHNLNSGCFLPLKNAKNDTYLKIRLVTSTLTVWTNVDGEWKNCFRMDDVTLPSHYYFGVSASTSDLAVASHYLISMATYYMEFENEDGITGKEQGDDPCRELARGGRIVSMEMMGPNLAVEILLMPMILIVIMALCVAGTHARETSHIRHAH